MRLRSILEEPFVAVAWFRFYAELNDFLAPADRGKQVQRHFDVSGPVKDLIEGFGVPHTEVDLVLINGESAAFSRVVHDGDRVSVYPIFESLDIASISQVRPAPLETLQFVLDVHLGRLAAYLRMAGFDALYGNTASDSGLAAVAHGGRILLTRDRYLLMRSDVERGYWIRSAAPKQQLLEVVKRFHMLTYMRPFTRCMKCNNVLEPAIRDSVMDRLPPGVRHMEAFLRCPGCDAVYWEGTHHARMAQILEWVKTNAGTAQNQLDAGVPDGGAC